MTFTTLQTLVDLLESTAPGHFVVSTVVPGPHGPKRTEGKVEGKPEHFNRDSILIQFISRYIKDHNKAKLWYLDKKRTSTVRWVSGQVAADKPGQQQMPFKNTFKNNWLDFPMTRESADPFIDGMNQAEEDAKDIYELYISQGMAQWDVSEIHMTLSDAKKMHPRIFRSECQPGIFTDPVNRPGIFADPDNQHYFYSTDKEALEYFAHKHYPTFRNAPLI